MAGRRLKLSRERLRLIAPVGAAAGLAAAFNSPITAVLVVIEEVVGRGIGGALAGIEVGADRALVDQDLLIEVDVLGKDLVEEIDSRCLS